MMMMVSTLLLRMRKLRQYHGTSSAMLAIASALARRSTAARGVPIMIWCLVSIFYFSTFANLLLRTNSARLASTPKEVSIMRATAGSMPFGGKPA